MSVWLTRGTGSKVLKGSQVTSIDSKASTTFGQNPYNSLSSLWIPRGLTVQQFNSFAVFHPTCGRNISVSTPYLQLSITSVYQKRTTDSQLAPREVLEPGSSLCQSLATNKATLAYKNGPSLSRKRYSISPHFWGKKGGWFCIPFISETSKLKSCEDLASKEAMLGCRSGNPGLGQIKKAKLSQNWFTESSVQKRPSCLQARTARAVDSSLFFPLRYLQLQ